MPGLISGCKLVKQNVVVYLDHWTPACTCAIANGTQYVTHDAHAARICDNNDVHSEFVTTMTSIVRYSTSHLLSVDRSATRDTRSRLTGCVNLLLRQLCLCVFRRFSTRRKHRGGVALTFFRSLQTFRLTFLRMRNKCKITNVQRNNKAFSV